MIGQLSEISLVVDLSLWKTEIVVRILRYLQVDVGLPTIV